MSLPTITATGNLTADPELRFTQAGKAVATVSIATNRSRKTDAGWETTHTTYLTDQTVGSRRRNRSRTPTQRRTGSDQRRTTHRGVGRQERQQTPNPHHRPRHHRQSTAACRTHHTRTAVGRHTSPVLMDATRAKVLRRAGGYCERCGHYIANTPASVHHRRPRGMGGAKTPDIHSAANQVLLCGSGTTGCHGEIESNREQRYRRRLASPTPRPTSTHRRTRVHQRRLVLRHGLSTLCPPNSTHRSNPRRHDARQPTRTTRNVTHRIFFPTSSRCPRNSSFSTSSTFSHTSPFISLTNFP